MRDYTKTREILELWFTKSLQQQQLQLKYRQELQQANQDVEYAEEETDNNVDVISLLMEQAIASMPHCNVSSDENENIKEREFGI